MQTNNNILWNSTEAAVVTGGVNTREWCAGGIAIAMNDLRPGDLYVATQDDDLAAVFAKGAVAAIVAGNPENREGWPLLMVENVFDALLALGHAARYRTHATIISVQGRAARAQVYDVLTKAGTVHEGGRQMSLGLASLPDNVDYGLFGSSPTVQPDIAIITNCAAANRDTLFETMPVNGTVIINADDDAFLSVIARAKASCITNIITYGSSAGSDAQIVEILQAGNGTRVKMKIFGEDHGFILPPGAEFHSGLVAGLLVLKLTGRALRPALGRMEAHKNAGASESGIALIDPVLQPGERQAVFRVTNMIDLGFGRQTAVLDAIASPGPGGISFPKKDLAIPRKLASLDCVYTSKRVAAVENARTAIREKHGTAKIATITPSVLAPGDFLVFRDERTSPKAIFTEALRLVPGFKQRKNKLVHAV